MTEIEKAKQTQMTPTAWSASGDLSPQQWLDAGKTIARVGRAWRWWLGDWINYADAKWGDETYDRAHEVTDLSFGSLANCASLAKEFPTERRRAGLSWSHHAELASLDREAQDHWLNVCENEGLSQKQLIKHLGKGAKPPVHSAVKTESSGTPPAKLAAVPDPDPVTIPQHIVNLGLRIEIDGEDLDKAVGELVAHAKDLGFEVVEQKVAA